MSRSAFRTTRLETRTKESNSVSSRSVLNRPDSVLRYTNEGEEKSNHVIVGVYNNSNAQHVPVRITVSLKNLLSGV